MVYIKRLWWVWPIVILYLIGMVFQTSVGASDIRTIIPCNAMPALTGDTTSTVGTCATTTAKINGTAFAGTNGNLVGFGASNIPVDTGVSSASVGLLVTGSLTSAQILSLNTVPVTAIATPGANAVIAVDSFYAESVPTATAYAGAGTLGVRYLASGTSNIAVNPSQVCVGAFFTSTTAQVCSGGGPLNSTLTATSAINSSVGFTMVVAQDTCAATCGTINYWIHYRILTGF